MGRDPEFHPANVMTILLATDNHLGYMEKHPVRGDDSFRAFAEILQIARANAVDALLLGGDLFHDNKPSRSTTLRAMELLREATLGDSPPVALACRSDAAAAFGTPTVNYMNPYVHVSLPVFVIHGNHDDPTGTGGAGGGTWGGSAPPRCRHSTSSRRRASSTTLGGCPTRSASRSCRCCWRRG